MAYEIPQKLQYEEKIIFGLTFNQLIYAIIFLLPTVLIIKSGINLYVKLTLTMILTSLAILFMFLKMQDQTLHFVQWLQFREARLTSQKMKDYLGVKNIEKSTIIVKKTRT